jgi:hypothetical protein
MLAPLKPDQIWLCRDQSARYQILRLQYGPAQYGADHRRQHQMSEQVWGGHFRVILDERTLSHETSGVTFCVSDCQTYYRWFGLIGLPDLKHDLITLLWEPPC